MSKEAMTAFRAVYYMERFKRDEKMLGPNEQAALDFAISILEAEQEPDEPVAFKDVHKTWADYMETHRDDFPDRREIFQAGWRSAEKYTKPQPSQKPLTHEQRFDLLTAFEPHKNKWEAPAILIDMVEAAHGIKE